MRGFAEATEPKAAVRTAASATVKEALGRHPPPCPILSLDTGRPSKTWMFAPRLTEKTREYKVHA